jgi:extracellular elastinolytic metalloproteinase
MSPAGVRQQVVGIVASAAVVVTGVTLPSEAAPGPGATGEPSLTRRSPEPHRRAGLVDVRRLGARQAVVADRRLLVRRPQRARAFEASLGTGALVDVDPLTGTVRNLGRLDGYLSRPATGSAASVALAFVRSHLAEVGLTGPDLGTLRLRTAYVDPAGVHHLSWSQVVDGLPVFGNGLKVTVSRDGRVLSVQGSPVPRLRGRADAAGRSMGLSATRARVVAASDVGGRVQRQAHVVRRTATMTTWSNHDYAEKTWFLTPSGLRVGWSTYVHAGDALAYQHVIDAGSGRVLYRRSTVADEHGDAFTYDNYPGAPRGGRARTVNLVGRGWLDPKETFLSGRTAVVWDDLNDDNQLNPGEQTGVPGDSDGATFPLKRFHGTSARCRTGVCTWDPDRPLSWAVNRDADAAQGFYLASNFHDYLARPPISFTAAAGDFSTAGGDPVLLQTLDGASTAGVFPDASHIDNANMNTPPDGTPPTMQMYLWHVPGATDAQDPFLATSGAFDASIVYHEYTHGLSGRLVVDATGNSTLNSLQAGSMGEAWSDYYALDYLVAHGFKRDTRASGEVLAGQGVLPGALTLRTEAIDCAVGSTASTCTRADGTKGGYTYGDLPTIGGTPEVHASGEVWAQTLWDVRTVLGHRVADALVTRAMSLSPSDPSMLDMRNAVLQADLVGYRSSHTRALWRIFAHRGMGWYAGSTDSADSHPAQDFHVRPGPRTPQVTISGTVVDPLAGHGMPGALVRVGGQTDRYSAVTDASGRYAIPGLPAGTYLKVVASAPGHELDTHAVDTSDPRTATFAIRRDWVASSGGAGITQANGPDFSQFGCGPASAIDVSQGTGWGSTTGDDAATPTNVFVPKHIDIALPRPVDLTTFAVDPSATCGDPASSSTGAFRIQTSTNGTTWTTAAEGAFGAGDIGRYNEVPASAGTHGVRFVRFTILGNQVPDLATDCPAGAFGGCAFTDLTEVEAFGTPAS